MEKTILSSKNAPAAIGPYSQAVKSGGFVFCSGMIPVDPATGGVPEGAAAQTRQVLVNIKNLLADNGLELKNIVKTTLYIKNMDDFATINAEYAAFFESDPPARSTVEVARLPKDVLIEIESIVSAE